MTRLTRCAIVVVAIVCCAVMAEVERPNAMTWAVLSAAVVAVVAAAVVPPPADDQSDVLASRFDAPPVGEELLSR